MPLARVMVAQAHLLVHCSDGPQMDSGLANVLSVTRTSRAQHSTARDGTSQQLTRQQRTNKVTSERAGIVQSLTRQEFERRVAHRHLRAMFASRTKRERFTPQCSVNYLRYLLTGTEALLKVVHAAGHLRQQLASCHVGRGTRGRYFQGLYERVPFGSLSPFTSFKGILFSVLKSSKNVFLGNFKGLVGIKGFSLLVTASKRTPCILRLISRKSAFQFPLSNSLSLSREREHHIQALKPKQVVGLPIVRGELLSGGITRENSCFPTSSR